MRVRILAVGRLKAGPERELAARYLERARAAGGGVGLAGFEVEEIAESKRREAARRRDEEGQALLDRSEASQRVVLDETGKAVSSSDFAKLLGRWRDAGTAEVVCMIGGPDGHPESVRGAGMALSFGLPTWPHQLFRVMLAEQLYRAVTILSGHPYHRP